MLSLREVSVRYDGVCAISGVMLCPIIAVDRTTSFNVPRMRYPLCWTRPIGSFRNQHSRNGLAPHPEST